VEIRVILGRVHAREHVVIIVGMRGAVAERV
jgi:hypothetical protein